MKKIIDIKNISMKEKIALLATISVLLMVITKVFYNFSINEGNGINYNEDINIDYIISISDETNDRQVYAILNNVISSFINSYNLELKDYVGNINLEDINYTREDYYNVLSSSYKKKISKLKYNSLSEEFMQNFINSSEYGRYMQTSGILQNVYKLNEYVYSKNMYICKLNSNIKTKIAYIGIQLNEENSKYNIFYLGTGEIKNE